MGPSSDKVRTLLTSEGILIGPHVFKGPFEVGFRVGWRRYYNEESPAGACARARVCV